MWESSSFSEQPEPQWGETAQVRPDCFLRSWFSVLISHPLTGQGWHGIFTPLGGAEMTLPPKLPGTGG